MNYYILFIYFSNMVSLNRINKLLILTALILVSIESVRVAMGEWNVQPTDHLLSIYHRSKRNPAPAQPQTPQLPPAFVKMLKELKKYKPKLYEKMKAGNLSEKQLGMIDDYLLKDQDFLQNLVDMMTKGIPEQQNCLKALKLTDEQKEDLGGYVLTFIDWNKIMKGKMSEPTQAEKDEVIDQIKKDANLGRKIGQCVEKLQNLNK